VDQTIFIEDAFAYDYDNSPQRYPGQYFDSESGLNYNYFRDFDPKTGRYIETDPIGLAGGMNRYSYVDANPVNRIDPTGLFAPSLTLLIPAQILLRRSQTHRLPWSRTKRYIIRWLPPARICHPYPLVRLGVVTQGKSRMR
jgi:RHS repeat-associated protein